MPDFVVPLVGIFVVAGIATWIGTRATGRRYAQAEAGAMVRVPCRVRGTHAPFAPGFARGRIEVGPDRIVWTPRARTTTVDLVALGVRPQRVDLTQKMIGNGIEADNLFSYGTLVCHDDAGRRVELRARDEDLMLLAERLRAIPSSDDADRIREPIGDTGSRGEAPSERSVVPLRRWPLVLLAIGLAIMAIPAFLTATGETVVATVTSVNTGDETAMVSFTDPWDRSPRSATIDAYDDTAVGQKLDLLAPRWLVRGDAGTFADLFIIAGLFAVVPLLVGSVGFFADWRRRRGRQSPALIGPDAIGLVAENELAAPPRGRGATYTAVVEYLQHRGRAEGWPTPDHTVNRSGDEHGKSAFEVIGTRQVLFGALSGSWWWFLMAALAALLFAVPGTLDLIKTASPTATGQAEVSETDSIAIVDKTAYLKYEVDGRTFEGDAAYSGQVEAGDTVAIEYAIENPAYVRIVGRDGTLGQAMIGWVAVMLLSGVGIYRIWSAYGPYRQLSALLDEPGRSMRYAYTRDPDGEDALLLFDPISDLPPRFVVPVLPGQMTGVPWSGTCEMRGELSDGATAVPIISGQAVWPSGELTEPDADLVGLYLDPLALLLEDD